MQNNPTVSTALSCSNAHIVGGASTMRETLKLLGSEKNLMSTVSEEVWSLADPQPVARWSHA